MMDAVHHPEPGGYAVIQPRLMVVALAVLVCSSLLGAAPAWAEWFADLYAGVAKPTDHDVDFRQFSPAIRLRYQDVEFDRSLSYGGRFGKYFDGLPWLGVAVDVINFDPDIAQQTAVQIAAGSVARTTLPPMDISVTAVSVDLMLRLPLFTTQEIPGGRLQPYILGGPGLFFLSAHDRSNFVRRHQSDLDITGGYNAGGGLAWQFTRDLGLFGEYRYSHVNPEFEFHNLGARTTVETDINTHHFLLGLTVRF
jgi:opacity protein-like surface antigen